MLETVSFFRWQSNGATIEGRRNETLALRVKQQIEREQLARCDEENTR